VTSFRKEEASLVAALLIMVVWGCNFPLTKYVLDRIDIGPFLFVRFIVMTLLAFALLALIYRRHLPKSLPRRGDWLRFAAAGTLGHTLHVGVVMWGIDLSTAFSSALVLASAPIFTLLLLAAMGAERLRVRQLAGTAVAFFGIALFLSDKFAGGLARAGLGDLALLSASVMFSLYTIISKPLVERYGPLNLLAWTLAFGAPPMIAVTLPSFLRADLASQPTALWVALTWSIVVSSFLGWLVWVWVNAVRGIARSAPLQYLMPPIAGVAAWLTIGETFTWLKIVAAGVVMAGVAWAQLAAPKKTPVGAVTQPDPG
jgi:drug/metabolite transporter (DMT)-like permease